MTTEEFIEILKSSGYRLTIREDDITIRAGGYSLAKVGITKHFYEIYHIPIKEEILDAIIDYANTPLNKRKEKTKEELKKELKKANEKIKELREDLIEVERDRDELWEKMSEIQDITEDYFCFGSESY